MDLKNPVAQQDRAEDLYDTWKKYGNIMFLQQRRIYEQLMPRLRDLSILEAGAGNGVGGAMLARTGASYVGTDLPHNLKFAHQLYPWIAWVPWDILTPWQGPPAQVVVAVEVIEHVADANLALRNLVDACTNDLYISTPNGTGKQRPPSNPYHVAEYTPYEFLAMIYEAVPGSEVKILGWNDFTPVPPGTNADPLVYRIRQ